MGLAGPRKKRKLYADPANIKWERSSSSFGHKILSRQGWKEGAHLGAKNAKHAKHYSSASSAPIKMLVKDDNRGIGSRASKAMDEIPGLDVYEALLGRLNGKPEVEVKKEQDQRESVKRSKYIEQKFGTVRFVSAGLLITDEMTKAGGEQP